MKPKNELIESIKRHERTQLLLLYLKCLLALAGIVVILLLLRGAFLSVPPEYPDPGKVKKEVYGRLDARGLSRSTTVEVTETGYRFEWKGKFYRL
ncbi:MAG: hypothetical protein NUV80_03120 [Candidatus Berkelbacteria bacterium]|nr:hypothetical protein [Candidatus Berkelbacteria bacterium]